MEGGRTAHSANGIPIDLSATSTCNLKLQSDKAELIKQVRQLFHTSAQP